MPKAQFFAARPTPSHGELFDALLSHQGVTIERIISSNHLTPSESIQLHDEWVILLQGQASLIIAGEAVDLSAGEYIFIPALTPHTITATSHGAHWLAIHFPETDLQKD